MAFGRNYEPGDKFKRLAARIDDPSPMTRAVGIMIAGRMQQGFTQQGRGGKRWAARMVPNVPAIVGRLNRGLNPRPRHFQPRPAGINTGDLRRSINSRLVGKTKARIGSPLPYARKVHAGGRSTQRVAKSGMPSLRKFLRSSQGKRWRGDLGFLFTYAREGRPLTVKQRARPWLFITKQDRKDAGEVWEQWLRTGRVGG